MSERVPAKEVSFAADGLYRRNGELFTGVAYTIGPHGHVSSESEYRDGMRWGMSRGWYRDGTLAHEVRFYRDVVHGVSREWREDGSLESQVECELGITLSEQKWAEDGTLKEDYQLRESDSDFKRLQEYRSLYGATDRSDVGESSG